MATVTYNGKSTTLTDGQKATLSCAEKKAVTDIVAAFDGYGKITYGGIETEVEAGKTATLACAGKKMLTDVVIAMSAVAPVLKAGLYDANDNLVASWDTLVNTYGMDVEKDYDYQTTDRASPYYILTNRSELSAGSKLVIGGDVTCIGKFAFAYCECLASVTIPDSVTTIRNRAFQESGITSVTIGKGVSSVAIEAFFLSNISKLYITDIEAWCNIVFESHLSHPLQGGTLVYVNGERAKDIEIPYGVTSIGDYTFYKFGIDSITIPDSVTSIGYQAFCKARINSVTIPDSVTSIGEWAFASNGRIKRAVVGNGVSVIPAYMFYGCGGFTEVEIPASVTTIGDYAFSCGGNKVDAYYAGTKEQWAAVSVGDGNADVIVHYNEQANQFIAVMSNV